MTDYPPVHYFASLEDLDRSLANPKLTVLLDEGYFIEASTMVQAEQGAGLALVLVHRPSIIEVAPPAWRQLASVIGAVAIVAAGFGGALTALLLAP